MKDKKDLKSVKIFWHYLLIFTIPELNYCIEYDGRQHFEPVFDFGGDYRFEKIKKHDEIKNIYCLEHNIKLLRISYKDNIENKLKGYII